jgi:hypothetical protein
MTAHELCEKARLVACVGGALPGLDCLCELPGVHLSRCACARTEDVITFPGLASVISDHDACTGTTIILDSP